MTVSDVELAVPFGTITGAVITGVTVWSHAPAVASPWSPYLRAAAAVVGAYIGLYIGLLATAAAIFGLLWTREVLPF